MRYLKLPYVSLPKELVTLLKLPLMPTSGAAPIIEVIKNNKALIHILENSFHEFDDGRGIEKIISVLGWTNFRDRFASIYLYKSVYGDYPKTTNIPLVDDIKVFENIYSEHTTHNSSRIFLLSFYLKLANLKVQNSESNQFLEIYIPDEIKVALQTSQGRSEKIDWLILTLFHLYHALGEKVLMNSIITSKKFDDLYGLMTKDAREVMLENFLAYGASIGEQDLFLYGKI
ncbi:MAG: hypothetical protein AB7I27_18640 [Bacteriovoracaceae bacterium]